MFVHDSMISIVLIPQVPVSAQARAAGRTLTFAFQKGGAETSKLMNLLNLPMESSVVVRKMKSGQESGTARGGPSGGKGHGQGGEGAGRINPGLAVKAALSEIDSLDIELKPSEMKKMGRPSPANVDAGQTGEAGAATAGDPCANDEPDQKKRKTGSGKKAARGLTIKAYDDAERALFSTCISSCAAGAPETRPLTALDDIVGALRYAFQILKNRKLIDDEDSDGVLDTFGFCMSLWLEFVFQGKVSVSGREHRSYSLLRVDLQQTLLDANETLSAPGFITTHDSDSHRSAVNALELAKLLCESLTSQPVSEIIWAEDDDPDERAIRSLCEHMTCNREHSVTPWIAFISQTLELPIMMHPPLQEVMQALVSENSDRKFVLVDVVSVLYAAICKSLTPAMFGFAFDTATAYGERQHFVEGTDKAIHQHVLRLCCQGVMVMVMELLPMVRHVYM